MSFPTTNTRGDTRLWKWKKILGVLQNAPGALAGNNPRRNDTRRWTIIKVLAALRGVSSHIGLPSPDWTVTFDPNVQGGVGFFWTASVIDSLMTTGFFGVDYSADGLTGWAQLLTSPFGGLAATSAPPAPPHWYYRTYGVGADGTTLLTTYTATTFAF